MYAFRYGGKAGRQYALVESENLIAVRSEDRQPVALPRAYEVAPLSEKAREVLEDFELYAAFPQAGVEILRVRTARSARARRDRARSVLKKEAAIEFAGRVMQDRRSKAPVLYTENIFVKFDDDLKATACRRIIKKYGLAIKREIEYIRNGYYLAAAEGTGPKVFAIAERLLKETEVDLSHPELLRLLRPRAAFPQQWHLKKTTINGNAIDAHTSVVDAWELTQGEGVIIAVIDDGFDLDHEEFRSSGKTVAPVNLSFPPNHPSRNDPRPGTRNNHGTACAGVACADGAFGASGVAPRARLMPIRLVAGLGSQQEADAFVYAAQHGADVISCSWGPADGKWWDPTDPLHEQVVPLPDSTRLAIDWSVNNGRNGKGCVIVWAAGNGNESVDHDGYAAYGKVMAIAACNDRGKRAAYSDFGGAIWCSFPSSHGEPSLTSGIWTTDRSGMVGYNPGNANQGDQAGNYTNSFGGTSSATPGVAGAVALVLSRNPNLRWDEVRDLLKRSSDRIDAAGGNYDQNGHSRLYGYGRVNARRAVELAQPAQPNLVAIRSAVQDVPIRDFQSSSLGVEVADSQPLKELKVTIDIEHTYIGDLIVSLAPPAATGTSPLRLHNREGRGTDNIKKTYDTVNAPGLQGLIGKSPAGTWTLVVEDKAGEDVGKIRSLTLELHF
jgi:subtilisin family serine protease